MYVGVRDVIIHHAGYSTLVEGLDALELNAVELALGRDLTVLSPNGAATHSRYDLSRPDAAQACRERYDAADIHISGLLLANNFNAEDVETEIEWVAQALRVADILGADAVRIDSAMTAQQEIPLARRVDIYASTVRRVLEAPPESEAPLGIENHGYQGNDPEWMQGVLDAVDSPRLGLTLDTGNFYWAGLPLDRVYEVIEQFAPQVKHAHCKNICFEPERRNVQRELGWGYGEHVCPIPDGDVDHAKVAAILHAAGYGGGLNIEDESLAKFEGDDRKRQLRRDADHLAEVVAAAGG